MSLSRLPSDDYEDTGRAMSKQDSDDGKLKQLDEDGEGEEEAAPMPVPIPKLGSLDAGQQLFSSDGAASHLAALDEFLIDGAAAEAGAHSARWGAEAPRVGGPADGARRHTHERFEGAAVCGLEGRLGGHEGAEGRAGDDGLRNVGAVWRRPGELAERDEYEAGREYMKLGVFSSTAV